ncbi:Hypothetical predicted protein [Paramuricea clavata]|uniref:Uncharacterized protein n=1 Tax=Paramuricea clavata TaxID=317549 RepID=A0A7D9JXZ9_PARCT|nr:Hypothetical predicted protein [Paramuricea clavata]
MEEHSDRDGDVEAELSAELFGQEVEDETESAAMPPETSQTPAASSREINTLTLATVKLTERLSNQESPSVKETQTANKLSEAVQDGEGDCDELINRMLHAGQDQDDLVPEEEGENSDDQALKELLKEFISEDMPGESLQSAQLAKLVNKMFRTKMADQAVKDKLARQARSANCEHAIATRVNPGIWRRLREFTKKRDLQYYYFGLQQMLVKAILPVTRLVDISMGDKTLDMEKTQVIKRQGLEALSLLIHVNYELNTQRKMGMKPDIGKDYAALCSAQLPFTDMLFETVHSLVSAQRTQTIQLLKQSKPTCNHLKPIEFHRYLLDDRLCIVTILDEYLQRAGPPRKNPQLLLRHAAPHGPASKDTIARWLNRLCQMPA